MHLDALLADQPLTGGLEPRLGDSASAHPHHHRLSDRDHARPARRAEPAGLPYRWSTRAILLDKTDATKLLTKIRRQWFAKRKSIAAILKEVMTNEASVLVDTDAPTRRPTPTWRCRNSAPTMPAWPMSPRRSRSGTPIRALPTRSCGWSRRSSRAATSPHGRDGQRGRRLARQLPGHVYANVRQPPDLDAQSRPHDPAVGGVGGAGTGRAFRRAPAALRQDRRLDPVPVSLHVGDVGHTLSSARPARASPCCSR
jgi:type IV secretion system protein VirB4